MAEEFEQINRCQMCGSEYRTGRHSNEGIYIPTYALAVCQRCYDCNAEGWAPLYEQKLLTHLSKNHITIPKRNKKGFLPRE